jgi:hypothetical protein
MPTLPPYDPFPPDPSPAPAVGELVKRLRALSRHEHDDLSIGDEAASRIEQLEAKISELNEYNERLQEEVSYWKHSITRR